MPPHVARPGMPPMAPTAPVTAPGMACRPAVPATQSVASKPLFPSAVQVLNVGPDCIVCWISNVLLRI